MLVLNIRKNQEIEIILPHSEKIYIKVMGINFNSVNFLIFGSSISKHCETVAMNKQKKIDIPPQESVYFSPIRRSGKSSVRIGLHAPKNYNIFRLPKNGKNGTKCRECKI